MLTDKKEFRHRTKNGITILIKIPDHRPPHVHAFVHVNEEDIIIIETQKRFNNPGNLLRKQLKECQEWIIENKSKLMMQWDALEENGFISTPGLRR